MNKKYFFQLIFLFVSVFFSAQEKKILFIGNSLTYYFDMPQMLEKMLNENNTVGYKITQVTLSGIQLEHHVSLGITKLKFDETDWDDVVLQHGTLGYYVPEEVNLNIFPSIRTLQSYDKSRRAKFYLFATWVGKEQYPFEICYPKITYTGNSNDLNQKYCSKKFQSLEEEKDYLENQYAAIAKETNLTVTKHSAMEYIFEKEHPDLNMWHDDAHPSKIGSYFNACVFFKLFSDKNLKHIKENFDINPETASAIRNFVEDNYVKF